MEKLTLGEGKKPKSPVKDLSLIQEEPDKNEVADDLLSGLTIVLTGVFETIGREKLEHFINNHSGRCTGSVSGKTSYLIHGTKLEDGRECSMGNKYKTAKTKGVKILSENEFEQLIKEMSGN